jgi:hypothetical protein
MRGRENILHRTRLSLNTSLLIIRTEIGSEAIVLIGYFDDSGTHTNSEIVVMAGFVGTREQWQQFKKAWSDKLSEPLPGKPPLKRFHMVDCMQRDREFSDYSEAERDAVIHDFRQTILDAKLIGNVTAVDRVAWDEIMVGPLRMLYGDAEWYCLNNCMSFSINQATNFFADNAVELFFDNRPEIIKGPFQAILSKFEALYNGDPQFPRWSHLVKCSFVSSEEHKPLQAADMLAWESNHHALSWLHGSSAPLPRPHLLPFVKTGLITAGFADRGSIEGMASMLSVT